MTVLKKLSILTAVLVLGMGTASATVVNIDVNGAQGWGNDLDGNDANNTVLLIDVGAEIGCVGCAITIDQIGWEVGITANGLSWYSEAAVQMENSDQSAGVFLTPGTGDNFGGLGIEQFYSSAGLLDLVGLDLDFMLLIDGILRLEFTDTFLDSENPDSFWSGTISINAEGAGGPMPTAEPGILVLFGLGLIGVVVARRRSA